MWYVTDWRTRRGGRGYRSEQNMSMEDVRHWETEEQRRKRTHWQNSGHMEDIGRCWVNFGGQPAGQVFPGNRSPRGQGGRGCISRTVATWRTMEDDGPILGDKPAQCPLGESLSQRTWRTRTQVWRTFGGLQPALGDKKGQKSTLRGQVEDIANSPSPSPSPNQRSINVYPFQAFHLCNYQDRDTVPFLAPTPNCTDFTRVTLFIQNYADFAVFIFWCVPIFSPSPNGTSDNANAVYPFQAFHLCNYQGWDTVPFQPQPPIAPILPGLHFIQNYADFVVFIFWCVPIFSPSPNGTSDNANAVYLFQLFHLYNYQDRDTLPFSAPTPNCTYFTRVTLHSKLCRFSGFHILVCPDT